MSTGLLLLFSLALVATAVRHWYVALCGLVVFAVLMQHPAMPHQMLGLQGLNPWNVALLAVLGGWVFQRRREPPPPRPPASVLALLGAYLSMLFATGIVGALDVEAVQGDYHLLETAPGMLIRTIVDPLRYLVVAGLIYMGANSRQRVRFAVITAVVCPILYAVLQHSLLGTLELEYRQIRRLSDARIGLHPVALAQVYCFGIWSAVVLAILAPLRRERITWSAGVALIGPALLSTYARNGYASFCSIGIGLAILRWRSLFFWVPIVALVAQLGVPSVGERNLSGVKARPQHPAETPLAEKRAATDPQVEYNWDKISSGRTSNIWPPVLAQIGQSPIWGHGRFAILREPCYAAILAGEKHVPSHPHSAYLEILLDAGVLGLAACFGLFFVFGRVGLALICSRDDTVAMATGFVSLVSLISLGIAGLTAASFYPRQETLPNLVVFAAACALYLSGPATDSASEPVDQLSD